VESWRRSVVTTRSGNETILKTTERSDTWSHVLPAVIHVPIVGKVPLDEGAFSREGELGRTAAYAPEAWGWR